MAPFSRRGEHHLQRYWDALVTGAPPDELARLAAPLDPSFVDIVGRIRAGHQQLRPDPAFVTHLESQAMNALTQAPRLPIPLRPAVTLPQRTPSRAGRRPRPTIATPRRWAWAQAATAALLVLTLLGTYLVFRSAVPNTQDQPSTFADVPTYKANPARTGENPGPGPSAKPVELWRLETRSDVRSSPAIVGGVLYVGSGDGNVYALDARTGTQHWVFATGGPVYAHPTVAGGLVFIGSEDRILYALDAATGAERWRLADAGVNVGAVAVDGTLYVGTDAGVLALDPATGAERWRFTSGGALPRSPALADGVVYAGSSDGNLYAIDAASGTEIWRFATDGGILATPTVAGGIVYQAAFDGPADRLYAIDAATGAERWRFALGVAVLSPAVGGGMLYVGAGDGALYALDAANGLLRWRFATDAPNLGAAPALVGDTLYVAAEDDVLYALDAASGTPRWQVTVGGSGYAAPVVTGGIVYVPTFAGALVALGDPGAVGASTPGVASTPADSTTGAPVEYLWQSTGGPDPLDGNFDVAIHPLDGNVWVLDSFNNRFQILSPDGAFLETWGEAGASEGQFNLAGSGGLAFDSAGNLYVADGFNRRVQKFAPDRTFVTAWDGSDSDTGPLVHAGGVEVDNADNVYVTDGEAGVVQKFNGEGHWLLTFGEPGSGPGQLTLPSYPAFDAAGNLYVAEVRNNRVSKFAPDGTFVASWGRPGTGEGQFREPNGVEVNTAGNIYVADHSNGRVQVLDANGQFIFLWEGADLGDEFGWVFSVELDGQGNIYVAAPNRVLKFRLLPPLVPA